MRIFRMQRFAACLGVWAVFLVLFTAPLFHHHDRDDHGGVVSLIHAHFWEFAEVDSHSYSELEAPHSHANARWIDFFVCKAPSASTDIAVDIAEKLVTPLPEDRDQVTIESIPQAHGPPVASASKPRSPPSV